MNRYHLLAAEMWGYSFANYENHLGIGKVRYDRWMPNDARTLERAEAEKWPIEKVAKKLEVDLDVAKNLVRSFRLAKEVVDAGNAAESFRWGVRHAIENAVEQGLRDEPSIERLITQICYRAADSAIYSTAKRSRSRTTPSTCAASRTPRCPTFQTRVFDPRPRLSTADDS